MAGKRILFDQNAPIGLRRALADHHVATALQMGWSTLSNGNLISAAENAGFELMVSCDQSLRYQQNLTGRSLSLVVLETNHWVTVRERLDEVIAAIGAATPGSYTSIGFPLPPRRRRRPPRGGQQ